jgi:hypothetical protein
VSSVVYLQGSIGSVFVGPTGHNHISSLAVPDDDVPFAINCAECEPYLVRNFGAVYNRSIVPLTDRQIEARERASREGGVAVQKAAEALAKSASSILNEPPEKTYTADQVSRMIAAEVEKVQHRGPGRPRKVKAE